MGQENLPENDIEYHKKTLNKLWRDPAYRIQQGSEMLTLKELYEKEVAKNKKDFLHMHELAQEAIPEGKYVLFVNSTASSPLDNPKYKYIDEERKKLMFQSDTGMDNVPINELLDRNVEYRLGIKHGDGKFAAFHLQEQDLSELPLDENCVGVIFSGSEMNMHETEEKDKEKVKTVQSIFNSVKAKGIPVLGVCFGAQMTASSLGAEVKWLTNEKGEKIRSTGNEKILVNNNAAAILEINENPAVIQNHGQAIDTDSLSRVGTDILATSQYGNAEIYSFPPNIVATQFHPEISTIKVDIVSSLNNHSIDAAKTFAEDISATRTKIFEFFLKKVQNYTH